MKKIIAIILIIFGISAWFGVDSAAGLSAPAGKAKISFLTEKTAVAVNESFNVGIIVDPAGGALDTVRALVKFPPDKLKAENFSLSHLYPTAAPGNYINNQKGIVSEGGTILGGQVKTKGVFGYITFKALSEGQAVISLTADSMLIRAGQERINKLALGQAVIKIDGQMLEDQDIFVQSSSHPEQEVWYSKDTIELSWRNNLPARAEEKVKKDILKYFYDFNQNPSADPSIAMDKNENQKVFRQIKDGIWYFHIKGQFLDNSFSAITHYKILIDVTAPNKIMPDLEKKIISATDNGIIRFATIDQTSGINRYEVAIDNSAFETQSSPYVLPQLKAGNHIIFVKAIDQAGNFVQTGVKLRVLSPDSKLFYVLLKKIVSAGLIIAVILVAIMFIYRKKHCK